ncbi:MAG: DUF192 domain-containing protein [Actinomycetota bacterium]|nr:DUF192 domain-containing protein [Actinomycetota bacterium]
MSTARLASQLAWVRRVALTLLVIDVVVFVIQGANRPSRPSLSPWPPTTQAVTTTTARPAGTAVSVTITPPAGHGRPSTHCFLVADTPQERARGLMGRRNLGGYEGMAFVYPADSYDSFYMRDTPLPLGIAFFSRTGTFLSSASMPPCPDTTLSCPQYAPAAPFRLALEVPLGQLGVLGVGSGTGAHLGAPCSA